MKSNSLISVVLCTYNGQRFLAEQLNSIVSQSLSPYEVVVCDDNSTDGTIPMLEEFARTAPFSVVIYRNSKRLGSTRNFQQGIDFAQGDLIALCDQDDRWKPDKLERLTQAFEDEQVTGVCTDADLMDDSGRLLEGSLWSRGHLGAREQKLFQHDPISLLLKQDVVTGATMMFRSRVRKWYREIPVEWVHDGWLAWMIVLHGVGCLKLLPECLTQYRVHGGQQTGKVATRVGARSEPLFVRMAKARYAGHAHHKSFAKRLQIVLHHWLQNGNTSVDPAARRLQEAIAFWEGRSELSQSPSFRMVQILRMLPSYFHYGNGLVSAGRDLWT